MTTSEAVYGRIFTRNTQRRVAALTSHHVLHHYSAPVKHCLQPAVMLVSPQSQRVLSVSTDDQSDAENGLLCSQIQPPPISVGLVGHLQNVTCSHFVPLSLTLPFFTRLKSSSSIPE